MSGPIAERWFEDLAVGDRFRTGSRQLGEAEIVAFARQWDNQPFHTDPEAARTSVFGGLAASGWHTAAVTMSLLVAGELRIAGGFVGAGLDSVAWPRPVRPGDTLRVEVEVIEARVSKSRPDRGIVKLRSTTFNQKDEPVQVMVSAQMVPRRPAAGPRP